MKKQSKIGGHLPVNEGLRYVPMNVRALDYQCAQVMISHDNGYEARHFEDSAVVEFKRRMRETDLYVHFPYMINACERAPKRRGFYKMVFRRHFKESIRLGAKGVVVHIGSRKGMTEELAEEAVVMFLKEVMQEGPTILLETDAGSKNGSKVGSLEFIARVLARLGGEVRMCLDTEHLYARGVDLWDSDVRSDVLRKYGKWINLVHLNAPDPEVELGSHRDRHNTPFEEFEKDSEPMIRDFATRYPVILERSSLAVQKLDRQYVRKALEK